MARIFPSEVEGGGDCPELPGPDDYIRPTDWLEMPTLVDGDQKIALLTAVYNNNSNYVAFTISGGDYTVDIGDGGGPVNVADGVKFEANLDWADYNASTLTSKGFRQSMIGVGAQAGQTLITADMVEVHTDTPLLQQPTYLDVVAAGSGFIWLEFYYAGYMQRFRFIGTCNINTLLNKFRFCTMLEVCEISDSSNVTNYSFGFGDCLSLRKQPTLDFTSVTSLNSIYQSSAIRDLQLDVTGIATLSGLCRFSEHVQRVIISGSESATTITNGFNGAISVKEIIFNSSLSAVTTATNAFVNCDQLSRLVLTGFTLSFSIDDCNMSAEAIDEMFTSLGDGTGSTVTVTDNPGSATCDTTIATAKNWTVVTA